jgi:lipopolysaccharide transport system ATP-binding protein
MARAAVEFEGVWKKFRRGERHDSLRDLIPSTARRLFTTARRSGGSLEDKEFWAVRDVSFQVFPGEALGIIGPNGAGKSTILKLLTRILKPTKGSCEVRGRAGALIEVAAGFHQELTGRENIYLQGAIMGMKRREIAAKFDEIVDFAGVSDFLDTPVKRYSSGMNARLGFAIAAHLDPDVLLVDEVLSVGDAAFKDKCVGRMRELIRRGIPVVFISHDLPAVLDLCTRAIVIDHGTMKFDGSPSTAVQEYRLVPWARSSRTAKAHTGPIQIGRAELLNDRGEPAAVFHTHGSMRVRIPYDTVGSVSGASFAIDVHSADDVYCAGINTLMDRRDLGVLAGSGYVELSIPQLNLLPGCYLISVGILDGIGGATLDLQTRAYAFSVISERRDLGFVYLPHSWTHQARVTMDSQPVETVFNGKEQLQ